MLIGAAQRRLELREVGQPAGHLGVVHGVFRTARYRHGQVVGVTHAARRPVVIQIGDRLVGTDVVRHQRLDPTVAGQVAGVCDVERGGGVTVNRIVAAGRGLRSGGRVVVVVVDGVAQSLGVGAVEMVQVPLHPLVEHGVAGSGVGSGEADRGEVGEVRVDGVARTEQRAVG